MSSESGQEEVKVKVSMQPPRRPTTTLLVPGQRNEQVEHPSSRGGSGIMETTGMRGLAYENLSLIPVEFRWMNYAPSGGSVSSSLGAGGKLSEVADLVVYLVSDRASYLHGTTVNFPAANPADSQI